MKPKPHQRFRSVHQKKQGTPLNPIAQDKLKLIQENFTIYF